MKVTEKFLFNNILVHTARTWERIRLQQPNQEMPLDNVQSVDEIVSIADAILGDAIVQSFLKAEDQSDYFMRMTDMMSDTYIESLAEIRILDNVHIH